MNTALKKQKKKSFWKTGKAKLMTVAAVLTALTVIITPAKSVFGFAGEVMGAKAALNEANTARVRQVVNDYSSLDDKGEFSAYADLFAQRVENFFGQHNITHEKIIHQSIEYQAKWPYRSYTIDDAGMAMIVDENKYIVTYTTLYQVKKQAADNWKSFNLHVHMTLDSAFKIISVYELKK